MEFVIRDYIAYSTALYTWINAKGQIVSFGMGQMQVNRDPLVVTEVEYNAATSHRYSDEHEYTRAHPRMPKKGG
jgi:hypothetical protein